MSDISEITLTRSGGVAGMIRRLTLTPASLPAAIRAEVLRLVAAPALRRAQAAGRPTQPDRFAFTLEVTRDGKREQFSFAEETAPAELHSLYKLAAEQKR